MMPEFYKPMIGALLLAAAIPCVAPAGEAEDPGKREKDVSLWADVDAQSRVRLCWRVDRWEENQAGFRMSRRRMKDDGEWDKWYSMPHRFIGPDFRDKRLGELKSLLTRDEVAELSRAIRKWKAKGRPVDPVKMEKLFHAKPGVFREIADAAGGGFSLAMGLGLAHVDDQVEPGALYEYALARAYRAPRKNIKYGEPVARVRVRACRGGFDCPKLQDFSAVRLLKDDAVRFRWKVAADDVRTAGRFGVVELAVLQSHSSLPADGGKIIHRTSLEGKPSPDGRHRLYDFTVPGLEGGRSKLAVVPVNRFGTRGRPGPRLPMPGKKEPIGEFGRVEAVIEGRDVLVKWSHTEGGRAAGYRIRRKVHGGEFEVVTDELLPPGKRRWTDGRAVEGHPGERLIYSVVAVSGDDRPDVASGDSEGVAIPKVPLPPPGRPADFTARLVEDDGGGKAVACSWKKGESRRAVSKYIVQRYLWDKKEWVKFADSRTTRCRKQWNGKKPESFALRVVAVAGNGDRSGPSDMVRLEVLPELKVTSEGVDFRVTRRKDHCTFFSWSDPYRERMAGYRLYAGDRLVAGEKKLGAAVRQYKTWDLPGDVEDYRLVAVGPSGRTSEPVVLRRRERSDLAGKGRDPAAAKKKTVVKKTADGSRAVCRREYLVWPDGLRLRHGRQAFYGPGGEVSREYRYRIGRRHGISRVFAHGAGTVFVTFHIDGRHVTYEKYKEKTGGEDITKEDTAWLKRMGVIR